MQDWKISSSGLQIYLSHYFQHLNAYHIIVMSFVGIKATNNYCNIITVESNYLKKDFSGFFYLTSREVYWKFVLWNIP